MRTQLLKNPSGRRALTGYAVIGTGTLTQDAGLDTYTTTTGSGAAATRGITLQTLTVGTELVAAQQYTLSASIKSTGCSAALQVAGAGVTGTPVTSTAVTAGGALTIVSVTFTAAASGTVAVTLFNTTTAAAGSILMFADALLEAGNTPGTYFDGATSGGYWLGTADNSSSVFPNSVPVLTAFADGNPSPRVLIVIPEVAPTCQTVNVTRITDGRTFKVRGGSKLFAVGGAQVTDPEPGIGTPNSYRAEMFDTTGLSLGFTPATATTIAAVTALGANYPVRAWISQPLKPALAILCTILMDTASDIVRKNPGELYYSEGATIGTRIGGQRQGITGLPFAIQFDTLADADEFQAMFGGYGSDYPAVLCIRTAPPLRIPRVFFASVSEFHELGHASASLITGTMSADETQPPSPGLVIPALRRMDIDAAFTTRAARAAAYATRLARDIDYSKAGLAGP